MSIKEHPPGEVAFYYRAEAYRRDLKKLMGRNVAGSELLKGYVRHGSAQRFFACCGTREEFDHFAASVHQVSAQSSVAWIPEARLDQLEVPGTLFVSAPSLGRLSWSRKHFGDTRWSLCGITHTASSQAVMNDIGDLLTAPLHEWDAVICTSRAVKAVISGVLERYGAYLSERLDANRVLPKPQLPVIPLGVDCDAFSIDDESRAQARRNAGIPSDAIVALFVGRLSFHAKAHPMPMYLALEGAAQATGARVILLQAGYFYNAAIEREFVEGARAFCPSVEARFVDGRDPVLLRDAWSMGDFFVSLVDNVQESFGLSPLEAMAAGLPVVVTDWDGYKDTVVNGETGFTVPVWFPSAGEGTDLAARYALGIDDYDRYIGQISQFSAVDVHTTQDAFERLIRNKVLRREMGEAGRRRALTLFDWSVVIPKLEDLWADLRMRRSASTLQQTPVTLPPLTDDPFLVFSPFSEYQIEGSTCVCQAVPDLADAYRAATSRSMNTVAKHLLPSDVEVQRVLQSVSVGPRTVAELAATLGPDRIGIGMRGIAWLAKLGIVRLIRPPR